MSTKEKWSFRKSSHAKNAEDGQGWEETEVNDTLNAFDTGEMRTPTLVLENHPADSRVKICENGIFQTLSSRMGTGGNNVPMVMESVAIESHPKDSRYKIITPETNQTIPSIMCHDAAHGGLIMESNLRDNVNILNPSDSQGNQVADSKGVYPTLRGCGGAGYQQGYLKTEESDSVETVVRRLTPMECERLQGFPDGWTDIGEWTDSKGKKHKDADSPRYKALGNSIALPYWSWMAERMVKQLKSDGVEHPTMASLFDGIGGFPLVFQRHGAIPVWASEIEEFPMAVTKIRFPEEES